MGLINKAKRMRDLEDFALLLMNLTPEEIYACAMMLNVKFTDFKMKDGKLDKESVKTLNAEEILSELIKCFGELGRKERATVLEKMREKGV